jgi:hypothetical protein
LPFTGIIEVNWRFVRFEVRLRKWLLPPLVRTSLPEPVKRKRLAVALCVFNLYFFAFFTATYFSCCASQTGLECTP